MAATERCRSAPQIIQLRNDQGESVQNAVGSAVFTNAYNAQETQYSPSITKQIAAFPNGSDSEQSGVAAPDAFTFSFTLHALNEDAPMPAGTSNGSVQAANAGSLVQFPAISFDSSHIGKTYHYEISEDPIESLNPAVLACRQAIRRFFWTWWLPEHWCTARKP